MLRDAATRHKPVAIVTDLREDSQLLMTRPSQKELSQVSSFRGVASGAWLQGCGFNGVGAWGCGSIQRCARISEGGFNRAIYAPGNNIPHHSALLRMAKLSIYMYTVVSPLYPEIRTPR